MSNLKNLESHQKLLNLVNSEKKKDELDLEKQKEMFASQLKKMKKEELFYEPKLSIWQKVKKLILGH